MTAPGALLNPECAQDKHPNCDRHTWHPVLDERTACRCPCHRHASACEYLTHGRDCTCEGEFCEPPA